MEVATPKSGGKLTKLATPAKVIKNFLRPESISTSAIVNETSPILNDTSPKPVFRVATYISSQRMAPRREPPGWIVLLGGKPIYGKATYITCQGMTPRQEPSGYTSPYSASSPPSSPRSKIRNRVQAQHKLQSTDNDRDSVMELAMEQDLGRVTILDCFRELGGRSSVTEYVAAQYYEESFRTQDKVVVEQSMEERHSSSSSDDDSSPFALQSAISGQNNDLKRRDNSQESPRSSISERMIGPYVEVVDSYYTYSLPILAKMIGDSKYEKEWTEYLLEYYKFEGQLNICQVDIHPPLHPDHAFLPALLPAGEQSRQTMCRRATHSFILQDNEALFAALTRIGAIMDAEIVTFSTFEEHHENVLFSSPEIALRRIPRIGSLAAHVMYGQDQPLIVLDTHKDWRFTKNVHVTENHHIRFFAAVPVYLGDYILGVLMFASQIPRESFEHLGELVAVGHQMSSHWL